MTARLFTEALPTEGGEITLDANAARYARVLRLRVGDEVVCFDGRGREACASISAIGRDSIRLQAEAPVHVSDRRPPLVLVQCLPKGDKLDTIVRMATELGVAGIHLAISERSVPRPDERTMDRRVERLSRIAREAVRQSLGSVIPDVEHAEPLLDVIARAPSTAHRILFYEGATERLALSPLDPRETWVVIGPEGGFSDEEAQAMVDAGFVLAGLGPMLLRVETAAPVALATVLDRLDAR